MKAPVWLRVILAVTCVAGLVAVFAQHQQAVGLRARQQQILAQLGTTPNRLASPPTATAALPATPASGTGSSPPIELLRLRGEFNQLSRRQREFASVRAENGQLRTQLAAGQTSASSGVKLPPGYLRRSEARMVGYNTPEDTIQSFLWAMQNRDITNLLQALAPESARQIQAQFDRPGPSAEDFFRDAAAIPGMHIVSRRQLPDGSIELTVETMPGVAAEQIPMRFWQIDGQWKLDLR